MASKIVLRLHRRAPSQLHASRVGALRHASALRQEPAGSRPAAGFGQGSDRPELPYRVRLIRRSRRGMSPAVTGIAAPTIRKCRRPFPNRTESNHIWVHEVEIGDYCADTARLLPIPLPARDGRTFHTHHALRRRRERTCKRRKDDEVLSEISVAAESHSR